MIGGFRLTCRNKVRLCLFDEDRGRVNIDASEVTKRCIAGMYVCSLDLQLTKDAGQPF
jgi:hypothetical protein